MHFYNPLLPIYCDNMGNSSILKKQLKQFIHPFSILTSIQGRKGAGTPSSHEAWQTPDRSSVHHRASYRQTTMHAHRPTVTPRVNFGLLINLTCIFWTVGGLQSTQREPTYRGRICKLNPERPQPGFEPGTLFL